MTTAGHPAGYASSPMAAKATMASPSLSLSAKTMGAERVKGVPTAPRSRSDFTSSPTLPGVSSIMKPLRKIARLNPGRTRISSNWR